MNKNILILGVFVVILVVVGIIFTLPEVRIALITDSRVSWTGIVGPDGVPSDDFTYTKDQAIAIQDGFRTLDECAEWGKKYGSYYYECGAKVDGQDTKYFVFRPQ